MSGEAWTDALEAELTFPRIVARNAYWRENPPPAALLSAIAVGLGVWAPQETDGSGSVNAPCARCFPPGISKARLRRHIRSTGRAWRILNVSIAFGADARAFLEASQEYRPRSSNCPPASPRVASGGQIRQSFASFARASAALAEDQRGGARLRRLASRKSRAPTWLRSTARSPPNALRLRAEEVTL